MLKPGDVYLYSGSCPQPPTSALPQNRTYRTVVIDDATNIVKEVYVTNRYWDAHMRSLDFDSIYNYPADYYWVERSIDDGITWHQYNAEELINGIPAWVLLQDKER